MKHRAKLGASNMKFHGFFSSGAIFQACEMISDFFIYSKLLGLRSRKLMKSTKNTLFWFFFVFFHPFERKHTADRLFKFVFFVFFGVLSLEILKNP